MYAQLQALHASPSSWITANAKSSLPASGSNSDRVSVSGPVSGPVSGSIMKKIGAAKKKSEQFHLIEDWVIANIAKINSDAEAYDEF